MGKRYKFYFRIVLLFSDFIIILASSCISLVIMKHLHPGFRFSDKHLFELFAFAMSWLIASILLQLYADTTIEKLELIYRKTIQTALLQALLYAACMLFTSDKTVLKFLLLSFSMLVFFFGISRFFVTYVCSFVLKNTVAKKPVAIVGNNEMGRRLASFFSTQRSDFEIKEIFDDESAWVINENGELENSLDQCILYASEHKIEEVYTTVCPKDLQTIDRLLDTAQKKFIKLRFVPDQNELMSRHLQKHLMGDFMVFTQYNEPLEDVTARVKKRVMDIFVSLLVIVFLLSWLIPLIGLLIKLESRGPVFYTQRRLGRNGNPFNILKFRTMVVTESDNEFKQAIKDDPRITKIGSFLRRKSLDEMPQFINVFFGQMSVIGPRPHPVMLDVAFVDSINWYMSRHFVKPGISGWAQVNGFRGETNTPELMRKRIEHDIWYIESWSLMLDLKIFFLTIINILRGDKKAY